MESNNKFSLVFPSRSSNESFARTAVAAFVTALDPTLEEINDIKTAVSEAVTNCIVHGYPDTVGKIYITCEITEPLTVKIKIKDKGCGIEDVKRAMEPLYTTVGGERAGLGFTVMQSFTDGVKVTSKLGKGTTVTLKKRLNPRYSVNEK